MKNGGSKLPHREGDWARQVLNRNFLYMQLESPLQQRGVQTRSNKFEPSSWIFYACKWTRKLAAFCAICIAYNFRNSSAFMVIVWSAFLCRIFHSFLIYGGKVFGVKSLITSMSWRNNCWEDCSFNGFRLKVKTIVYTSPTAHFPYVLLPQLPTYLNTTIHR